MTAKFCSSLRNRTAWISAVDVLYKAPPGVKWIENTNGEACFRFLLLSSAELDSQATQARLERFYTLDAHIAIIFLDENDYSAFVGFQIRMMQSSLDVPIIPIKSTSSLPVTVMAFCHSLIAAPPRMPKLQAVRALLPFCTINPPIREHEFNLLSDIVPSFKGMIDAISTRQGKHDLCSYIGQGEASNVIKFWTAEYKG